MTYCIDDKWERLTRILLKNKESSIVYVRNRRLSEELAQHLTEEGFTATQQLHQPFDSKISYVYGTTFFFNTSLQF